MGLIALNPCSVMHAYRAQWAPGIMGTKSRASVESWMISERSKFFGPTGFSHERFFNPRMASNIYTNYSRR